MTVAVPNWERYRVEDKIREILADVEYVERNHHFGRPFISTYQLAIEFERRNPNIVSELDLQIGGEGIGEYFALATYLANQLSIRIKNKTMKDIEGRFMAKQDIKEMVFADRRGRLIHPSMMSNQYDLSMFRLTDRG